MKLTFLGAARTTTGSKTLLEEKEQKILVDCGLFQGFKEGRLKNWQPFPITPSKIDKVILTHAHLDHTGYLPLLVKQGFTGPILATAATRDLCEILLKDAGRIQEEDAKRANKYGYSKHKPALPLYTEQEAEVALKQFQTFELGRSIPLGDDLVVQASRSGHILGSCFLAFANSDTTVVFSGDLGRENNPILKSPAQIHTADWLILESTYGNRIHPKEDPVQKLGAIIRSTAKRGGSIIIPSFAVGRTQVVLWIIHELKKRGEIPDIPVFLDSPMAQDVTDLLFKYKNEHTLSKEECQALCKTAHYIQSVDESKQLHQTPYPKIIIAGSGMVEGGRVLHHIKFFGPNPINTIVFVGYQATMTRGERILRGEKEVKIHGTMVPIRCHVESLESLSSHADYEETLEWLKHFTSTPRGVFLNHGEEKGMEAFKQAIEEELGFKVIIPYDMDSFDL
jgi:metallo-beta-lactamase family protein